MRSSLTVSATLHLVVLVATYFGLPQLFSPPPAIPAPIPVELVALGDLTSRATEAPQQPPKPQPKPSAEERPEPAELPPSASPPPKSSPPRLRAVARPELPPPPPPPPPVTALAALAPQPVPPPKPPPQPAEVEPPQPAARPAPKPPPQPTKVEPPQPAPAARPAPEPPRPEAKPPPRPLAKPARMARRAARGSAPLPRARPATKAAFDPDRISALLDKTPRQAPPAPQPRQEAKKRSVDDIEIESRAPARALASAPTISELDFIRRQLLDCWYLPGGAKDLRNMRVTIRVELDRDGTLARPPAIVERVGRDAGDPAFFRTFEESALRAVRACTDPEKPLQLPPGEAGKWRDLEFTFDPRDMLG